jgi:hypothetical protein
MYFCPKCNYSFDISKSTGINSSEEKQILKKVNDAIKIYDDKQSLNNYKAEFKKEDLEKNFKYKKLSSENKEKFEVLFQLPPITGAQFKCNNCSFTKEITETVLLYELDLTDKFEKIRSFDENQLICTNPMLPRTHDYICKNNSCSTIKNNKIKKEAVFFREKNSFKINYICTLCYHSW